MSVVYFLGTAGAGKSTLTATFAKWLLENGFSVRIVNLDPGAEVLPYRPDFDIRTIISLREIMKKEKLGPNGGLLRAMEIFLEKVNLITDKIKSLLENSEFLLIDTPGQLELFAFRDIGNKVISMIRTDSINDVAVFLIDAMQIKTHADVIMMILLSLAIRFHLNINVVSVINKLDIAGDRVTKMFEQFLFDTENFSKCIAKNTGVLSEMSSQLVSVLRSFTPPTRVVAISALKSQNMEDLFSIIHDAICTCGDLT